MKKAFTLIELLVVVAIIGIIGAFLIPAAGKAREAGRRAACANNLRQIGMAWFLYLDDNDGEFPAEAAVGSANAISCNTNSFGGKAGTFTTDIAANRPINRYLGIANDSSPNVELFHCLSDNRNVIGWNETWFEYHGSSYLLNIGLLNIPGPPGTRLRLDSIKKPHSKFVLNTSGGDATTVIYNNGDYSIHGGDNAHFGIFNILFLDGHVSLHMGDKFNTDDVIVVP